MLSRVCLQCLQLTDSAVLVDVDNNDCGIKPDEIVIDEHSLKATLMRYMNQRWPQLRRSNLES